MYAAHQFSALAAEPTTLREEASLPLSHSQPHPQPYPALYTSNGAQHGYPSQQAYPQQQHQQQTLHTGMAAASPSPYDRKVEKVEGGGYGGYAGVYPGAGPMQYNAATKNRQYAAPAADAWSAQPSSFNLDMSGMGQTSGMNPGYAPFQSSQQQAQQQVGGLSGGWSAPQQQQQQANAAAPPRLRRNSSRLPVGQIAWGGPPAPLAGTTPTAPMSRGYSYAQHQQQQQPLQQQQQQHIPPPPTQTSQQQSSHSLSLSTPPQQTFPNVQRAASFAHISPRKDSLYQQQPGALTHAQSFIEPRQLQQQQQQQQQQYGQQWASTTMRPAPVSVNSGTYRYYLGEDDGPQAGTQGLAATILSKVDSFGSKLADAFGLTAPANEQYGGSSGYNNQPNRPTYNNTSRGPTYQPPNPAGMAPYGRSRSDIYPTHDPTALV
ncbi:uncharacterized protein EV422DRAFT_348540 [Fimicolochytrium jonesii]|uniref:uncharacterized protein n=1 Tax=Fimicolochytrium jonesii TaxID=1396493 RepID=UPI0022FDD9E3|nr:uncharacterized protein EV422DRAFT_348540 [Fimicolochytrium jonesii]KAI8815676.1 hypothetical protein EV422DRAFT_348540 [Fimicolochytrium jonesii]